MDSGRRDWKVCRCHRLRSTVSSLEKSLYEDIRGFHQPIRGGPGACKYAMKCLGADRLTSKREGPTTSGNDWDRQEQELHRRTRTLLGKPGPENTTKNAAHKA